MIDNFISTTPLSDLIRYFVIAIVIVALSPYGIYLIRMAFAIVTGGPKPFIRKKETGISAVSNLESVAISRIEGLLEDIEGLQFQLASRDHDFATLENENEALKKHIRSLEAGEDQSAGAQDWNEEPTKSGSYDPDLAMFGLDPKVDHKNKPEWSDIKAAHRAAVKANHPDMGGDEAILKDLNIAYERLKKKYGDA
jgi:hypothetical protein